ncbi:hypothetical protein [Bordetella genomosp. 9]|uniref:Phage ABA sandwich domain-containing protein n=1 Tax=Bordetella genomosp. 9 TaxID=1416803 RepID=A0A1W6YYU2_9BORD|nr:hypothetical protein [Bordetella genomosp. 9]ARP86260.1 hypothetical protein CAL13_08660 [Bordetella genomosp. 9]
MNDRMLLEAAARAAGIVGTYDEPIPGICGIYEPVIGGADCPWNPLANDGQALRLAVKLHIQISIYKESATVWAHTPELLGYGSGGCPSYQAHSLISEPFGGDPNAATRRAIVRAAAAMGSKSNRS